jgi:hypothetical protein
VYLAIASKGDPILRADKLYVRHLLDIYINLTQQTRLHYEPAEVFNAGTPLLRHDRNPDGEAADGGLLMSVSVCV